MAAHHEILAAAQRICADRPEPVFTPDEIVRALPHLNAQTVRTHVTSRCCVNARLHHQSRLEYFRKKDRGQYELLPQHRTLHKRQVAAPAPPAQPSNRDAIHAFVTKSDGAYVVDCHEIAVVTQGKTIDEALVNLTEAVTLHLEGEDLANFGLGQLKWIRVLYELPADVPAA